MTDNPSRSPDVDARPDVSARLRSEEAASARSGFVLITGAKLWFLISATVLNLGLPRFLGDASLFGDFGTINSLISILNMVLVTGTLQAVSKRVSERPELAYDVRRQAIRLQSVVGGGLFVLLVVGADVICADLLKDETLAPYLRIAAVVTLSYAFYASFIGVLNGLRDFAKQALFDIAFATLKVALIVGLVLAGFGVIGAFVGFAAAALIVTLGAWWVTRARVAEGSVARSSSQVRLLGFMLQVMGFVFALNLVIQGDVVVLKRAAFNALKEGMADAHIQALIARDFAPSPEGVIRTLTATVVGFYRAAKNISLLPYQGVIALTFVIFPLLSRATFETDQASTRVYVRNALRVAWLIVLAIATALLAGGEDLAGVLFGQDYELAGAALLPMIIGMSCLAMMYLIGTVLIAASHPLDALAVTASVALSEMVFIMLLISELPASALDSTSAAMSAALLRVAWTSAGAGLLGLALAAWRLWVRLNVPFPVASISCGALASIAALTSVGIITSWAVIDPAASTFSSLWVLFVRALLAGVVFVLVLVLTRQITRDDWAMIRSTLSRRKVS